MPCAGSTAWLGSKCAEPRWQIGLVRLAAIINLLSWQGPQRVPELTPLLIAAAIGVLLGAVVQGSVGFGMGLVAAPVLTLALPELMPATLLMLGASQPVFTLVKDWRGIDPKGLLWALIGRLPGALLGTGLLVFLRPDHLGLVVGLSVLVAALLQWKRWTVRKTNANVFTAGFVSGITGTAAGIGGPPLAMVYARESGTVVRGTLAAYFILGVAISLTTLGVAARVTIANVWGAVILLPALVIGSLLARPLARYLDSGRTRTAILLVAGISGLVLLIDSLVG